MVGEQDSQKRENASPPHEISKSMIVSDEYRIRNC